MRKTIIFICMALFLSTYVYATGLGVAPATLRFENALKGAVTEKQLTIQNPGEKDISASVEIEGLLKDWITIEPAESVKVPAKGEARITVLLAPPEDEADGEYKAKVHVKAVGDADIEGSGMGLLPGVSTDIIASITDKRIISGEVSRILTKDEKYGEPVIFTIGFENTGNVPAGPDVKIEIEKRGTGIIDTVEEKMEDIKAGTSSEYKVEWDSTGQEKNVYYRAVVTVLLDGKVIEKKEEVGFRILDSEQETEAQVPPKTEEKAEIPPIAGLVVIIGIVVLGLLIFFVVGKKK